MSTKLKDLLGELKEQNEDNVKYRLKNGDYVIVYEDEIEGMAGESMTILQFKTSDNQTVSFNDIKNQLSPQDKNELKNWIDDLYKSNYAAAIQWIK